MGERITIGSCWNRFCQFRPVAILRRSVEHAAEAGVPQAATSISYYTLFSIIPFLLIVLSISSMLAEPTETQEQIISYILSLFPQISQDLIQTNLNKLLDLRGQVRIVSFLIFLWGATGAFSTLIINLNRAGENSPQRYLLRSHLKAVGIMTILAALLPVSFLAKGLIQLFVEIEIPWLHLERLLNINPLFYKFLPYLVLFGVLTFLYRWGPHHTLSWKHSAYSAVIISLILQGTSSAFMAYLARGISRYNVLYGSLGAVLALLFWLFLICTILLYGAHLGAALDHYLGRPVEPEHHGFMDRED